VENHQDLTDSRRKNCRERRDGILGSMGEQGIFYDVFSTNKKEWDAEQWREHCRELGRAGRTKRQEANQRQWDIGYWLLAGAKHFKRVSISAGRKPD